MSMDDTREGRAVVAIRLDGQTNRALGVYQRAIFDRFKGDGRTVRNIPRRLTTLPLFDLGRHDEEAFEIVRLAIRRSLGDASEIHLTLGYVQARSGPDTNQYISAVVTNGVEELSALRQRMSLQFERYGFDFGQGTWRPHIPITRITGITETPELPSLGDPISFRARSISIFGPKVSSSHTDVIAHRFSIPLFHASNTDQSEPTDDETFVEIGEQLDERIAQLHAAFATQRRRLKPKLETPDDDGETLEEADELTDNA